MIIYFTGTGNSRYIGRTMADALDDIAVDATKLIKSNEHPNFNSEKPYVFVAPTYAWRFPRTFEQWLKKCSFTGNKNVYYILNCGSEIAAAGNYLAKPSEKMGLKYMGTAEVVMPENYLIMFTPTKEEEDKEIISAATEKILELCKIIRSENSFDKAKLTLKDHLYSDFINPMFYTFYVGAKKFYSTDACISCGICESACMLNNIKLVDGKPVWGNNCTHCLCCICQCPKEAIEYGKNTKGRRRYFLPDEKEQTM